MLEIANTTGTADRWASATIIPTSTGRVAAALAASLSTIVFAPPAFSHFDDTALSASFNRGWVSRDAVASAENLCIAKVRSYSNFELGWAGPGSVPPSNRAIRDTEQFLRSLFKLDGVIKPHISASTDGEVNLFWDQLDHYVDLGFVGDGTFSYFARLSNGVELAADSVPTETGLPDELRSVIALRGG